MTEHNSRRKRLDDLANRARDIPREQLEWWINEQCTGDLDLARELRARIAKDARWTKLLELLRQVNDVPRDRLDAWIAERCGGDAELDRMLRSSLANKTAQMPSRDLGLMLDRMFDDEQRLRSLEGHRIEHYELRRFLGRGGMGLVFEAYDHKLGRSVAFKILRPSLNAVGIAAFRREAHILANLSDPRVAVVYDSGVMHLHVEGIEDHEALWMALEIVDGVSIVDAARGKSIERKVALLSEVALALQAVHSQRVVHGDVTPANVLVDAFGRVKLIDFGLAEFVDRSAASHERSFGGTLAYMAPEVLARGDEPLNVAQDVFSFGMVALDVLSERRARRLTQASPTQVFGIVSSGALNVDAFEGVPRELRWVIERATQPERTQRYTTMSELHADLARFVRHEPLSVGPRSFLYVGRKLVQRRPWRVLVTITGVVATMLAVAQMTDLHAQERASSHRLDASIALLDELVADTDPYAQDPVLAGSSTQCRGVLMVIAEGVLTGASRPADSCRLLSRVGRALLARAFDEDAERLFKQAQAIALDQLGEDSFAYCEARHDLGVLCHARDDSESAEQLLREALARCERVAGAGDERTIRMRDDLAELLTVDRRRASEFIELLQRNLADERMLRPVGRSYFRALERSVEGYLVAGRPEEAQHAIDEFTAATERAGNADESGPARALVMQARLCALRGESVRAIDLSLQASALWARTDGEFGLRSADALSVQATPLIELKRYDDLRRMFERVVPVYEARLAHDAPRTLIARSGFVNARLRTAGGNDDLESGLIEADAVIRDFGTVFGVESMRVAIELSAQACTLLETREFVHAERLARRALEIFERRGGTEQGDVGTILETISVCRGELGDVEAAVAFARRSVADFEALGPNFRRNLRSPLQVLCRFLEPAGCWAELATRAQQYLELLALSPPQNPAVIERVRAQLVHARRELGQQ